MRYLFCLLAFAHVTLSEAQAPSAVSDECLNNVDAAIDAGVDLPECEE